MANTNTGFIAIVADQEAMVRQFSAIFYVNTLLIVTAKTLNQAIFEATTTTHGQQIN